MKRLPTDAPGLAAHLLLETIRHYECSPALRRQAGIDLKQLAEVGKIRRQLLKQRKR